MSNITAHGFDIEAPPPTVIAPSTKPGGLVPIGSLYKVSYVTHYGETYASAPSAPSTTPVVLVNVPTRTIGNVIARRIYRADNIMGPYNLLLEIPDNRTLTHLDYAASASGPPEPDASFASSVAYERGWIVNRRAAIAPRSDIVATAPYTDIDQNTQYAFVTTTGAGQGVRLPPTTTFMDGMVICVVNQGPDSINVFARPGFTINGAASVPLGLSSTTFVVGGTDWKIADAATTGSAPTGPAGGPDLGGLYPAPVLTLTGVNPGTYGDPNTVPRVTVDNKGRVQSVTSVPIAFPSVSNPDVLDDLATPAYPTQPQTDGVWYGSGARAKTGGAQATVIGNSNGGAPIATGTIVGASNTASATATIVGRNNTAVANAVAIGESVTATAVDSTAVGRGAAAGGLNAVAVGMTNTASQQNATAVGQGATASALGAIAVGSGPTASASNAIAAGTSASAAGVSSIAIGLSAQANATATSGVAVGSSATALAVETTAVGSAANANVQNASAFGRGAQATGPFAVALAATATASADSAVAVGRGTNATGTNTVAVGRLASASATGALAVGVSSDASQVDAIAVGNNAQADAPRAVAIGGNTATPLLADSSVAIGWSADALNIGSIAIGRNAQSGSAAPSDYGSVSIGDGAQALSETSIAIGSFSQASGGDSPVAVGYQSYADGAYTSAFGRQAVASAEDGTAIGRNAGATAMGATALGAFSTASAQNAVAIGNNAKATTTGAIAIGTIPATPAAGGFYATHRDNQLPASGRVVVWDQAPGAPEMVGLVHPASDGRVLSSTTAGALSWVVPNAGTVTDITAGAGLTGGTITASGTIGLGPELSGLASIPSLSTGIVQKTGPGTYTTLATPLDETFGGTGTDSYNNGDILYGVAPSSLAKLAAPPSFTGVLQMTPAGSPSWINVSDLQAGLIVKEAVNVTTIANISGYANTPSNGQFTGVDMTSGALFDLGTYVVAVNDRVLVKNQADARQNGIYIVTGSLVAATLTRSPDMDGTPASEVAVGCFVFIDRGSLFENTSWVVSGTVGAGPGTILTLNTDNIVWQQFSSTGGAVSSITGTANQVIASAPTGAVTLSLPQDIATSSSPTFNNLILSNQLQYTNGVKVGDGTTSASATGVAVGKGANAGTANSVAIGPNVQVFGAESIAIGNGTTNANGLQSIAIGQNTGAGAQEAIAIGRGATTTVNNSIAMGTTAQATASDAIAIGTGVVANVADGFFVRHNNVGSMPTSSRVAAYDGNQLVGLPDGATGQVLSANGTGGLSWATPSAGTVTQINTGLGLTGGPITNSGTIALANDSITVTAGAGLSGGGLVALGGSVALANTGVTSATGTTNQVLVNGGLGPVSGAVTFSTPQDIATTSSPTFNNLTLSNQLLYTNGIEVGDAVTSASATGTAVGKGAVASATNAVAMGNTVSNAGTNTVAIGSSINIAASNNSVFVGHQAGGTFTPSASFCVGIGQQALSGLTTGTSNVGVGAQTLATVSGGNNNVAMGIQAINRSSGDRNTAVGATAYYGGAGANGSDNTAIGNEAMFFAVGAANNTVLGSKAGFNLTSGSNNVCVGMNSGLGFTTGSQNVNIGHNAGLTAGTQVQNTVIGANANAANRTGAVALGYNIQATADDGFFVRHRENQAPASSRVAVYAAGNELVGLIDGTAGQVLSTNGTGGLSWTSPGGGGTVTSVTAGTGLNVGAGPGGVITGSGILNLADTAVSAGSYGSATQVGTFTVDQQGRLTAAGNTTIANIPNSSLTNSSITVTAGTGLSGGGLVALGGSVSLNNTGVLSFQTSLSGLSPSTAQSGAVTLSGTLGATSGGTGQSTYAVGNILYADTTSTLAKLPIGSDLTVLVANGGVPTWSALNFITTPVMDNAPGVPPQFPTSPQTQGVWYGTASKPLGTSNTKTIIGNNIGGCGLEGSAFGYQSNASGQGAFAAGYLATATGDQSIAIGSTNTGTVANAPTATGLQAIAIGCNTDASAQYAIAMGVTATATALNSLAIGTAARTTSDSGGVTNGIGAIAIGVSSTASFDDSIAIGSSADARNSSLPASQTPSIAIGAATISRSNRVDTSGTVPNPLRGINAGAVGSITLGKSALAINGSVAIGQFAYAEGDTVGNSVLSSVAIGKDARAGKPSGGASVSIGENAYTDNQCVAIGTRASAQVADQGFPFFSDHGSVAVGRSATALSMSVAVGRSASAGAYGIAIGESATAADRCIAIGSRGSVVSGYAGPNSGTWILNNRSPLSFGCETSVLASGAPSGGSGGMFARLRVNINGQNYTIGLFPDQ